MALPLTVNQLRDELQHFAATAIRDELALLKATLVSELQNQVEREQSRLGRKLVPEALHGAPPGEGPVSDSRTMARGEALLGDHAKERSPRRAVPDSARYMGLEAGDVDSSSETVSSFRMLCINISHNHYFEVCSAWLVVLNAIWIGICTDWVAKNWTNEVPSWFNVTDWAFCIFAIIELSIRMVAHGSSFFHEDHWRWNLFDSLVVLTQVADLAASMFETPGQASSQIQGLRTLRLARILRIARVASAFPELHILMSSIVDSLQSLFWTMVLILASLYGVAVVITDVVSDHKIAEGREIMEKHEEMLRFFGSLDSTMVALYMVISDGIHWSELMTELEKALGGWVKYLFVAFTGFELFAMMNIITACFVDSAMKIAAKAEQKAILDSLWELLGKSASKDAHTGQHMVTKAQFLSTYGHESMKNFLDLINVPRSDADHVFAMIDRDGDGSLTAAEFLVCCERLMGPSKASMMVQIANEGRERAARQDQALKQLSTDFKEAQDEVLRALREKTFTR